VCGQLVDLYFGTYGWLAARRSSAQADLLPVWA